MDNGYCTRQYSPSPKTLAFYDSACSWHLSAVATVCLGFFFLSPIMGGGRTVSTLRISQQGLKLTDYARIEQGPGR